MSILERKQKERILLQALREYLNEYESEVPERV